MFRLLLIADETPEIHLQIVRIHLYLLQAKLAKGAQAHALQQRLSRKILSELTAIEQLSWATHLETNLNDAHNNGSLAELHGGEDVHALREQTMYIGHIAGLQLRGCIIRPIGTILRLRCIEVAKVRFATRIAARRGAKARIASAFV